jgi:hypothetical protein
MGVLEDAIRDHLDLRKRHGVSDEELRRQEAEALGPARREAEGVPEEHAVATEQVEEHVEAEAVEPSEVPAEEALEEPAPALEESAPPLEEPAPALDEPASTLDEPAPAEHFHPGDETTVYRPPEVEEDAGEQHKERDRLWPEQKPPSDLDFE